MQKNSCVLSIILLSNIFLHTAVVFGAPIIPLKKFFDNPKRVSNYSGEGFKLHLVRRQQICSVKGKVQENVDPRIKLQLKEMIVDVNNL